MTDLNGNSRPVLAGLRRQAEEDVALRRSRLRRETLAGLGLLAASTALLVTSVACHAAALWRSSQ